jgi:hypothetical protein
VCAVVSLGAAGVAWWRANLSKRARADAEKARDAAERSVAAVEKIAQALDGPPFIITRALVGVLLTSNRAEALTIEEWVNADAFEIYTPLNLPLTLGGFRSVHFAATAFWGDTVAVEMVLRVRGLGDVGVPFPASQG